MNYFAVRITSKDETADDICKKLFDLSGIGGVVLTGHEYSIDNVEHTHSVMGTFDKMDKVRRAIKAIYTGNRCYSMKTVNDLPGACQYAMKCGDYTKTDRFPEEPYNWAIEHPWVFKHDAAIFKKLYKLLDEQYLGYVIRTDYDYVDKVLALHAEHERGFRISDLKRRWLRIANMRNGDFNNTFETPKTIRNHLIWSILRI